ncbi:response regulator transcription factor [Halopseudomonas pertucinogena]|uniref:DNA-binding response regulator n=1 Tax=Halopseudomonas pertucinogena TaxID=86175 RepID=A0ABQ2CKZ0_9GAMM|nr:response regulator transcription factor [Halopseudomonas pertucinogena]GGI93986.1 DNA-binding response regulator [Halopseudomonas pertucinogena]
MRLLLAEDNVSLADSLMRDLRQAGYVVDWRADGRDAQLLGEQEPYDLCVLDLGLPGRGGLQILHAWREQGLSMPVLVLSARSSWAERVEGLRAGADDYLGKPFSTEELLLRIQGLLRRSHGREPQRLLRAAGLTLDEASQQVSGPGLDNVQLSASEFRMLRCFMLHAGQLVSKARLAEHLYDNEAERDSNVIEVQINHLRRKLGRQAIETRRGQGYVLVGLPE